MIRIIEQMQILDQLTDNLLFIVCTNDHSKSFLLIINFFFWSAAKKAKERKRKIIDREEYN